MAQVYEAEATLADGATRRVAFKRILPEHAGDPDFRRMFLDEVRIASLLDHPGIVRLLDFGFVDGAEFGVLELVEGLDAGEAFRRVRAEHPDEAEGLAACVGAAVAEALAYAHGEVRAGDALVPVVHRDVSPSNVLIDETGLARLTDFGIALADVRAERTRTGVVKGKADFMAPEQAAGLRVGPPADVYSLAVTVHALAKGWPAASREDASPSLSAALRAVLEPCWSASAAERPSAAQLATNLARLAPADASERLAEVVRAGRREAAEPTAFDRALGMHLVPSGDTREYTVREKTPTPTAPPRAGARVAALGLLVAVALGVGGWAALRAPATASPDDPTGGATTPSEGDATGAPSPESAATTGTPTPAPSGSAALEAPPPSAPGPTPPGPTSPGARPTRSAPVRSTPATSAALAEPTPSRAAPETAEPSPSPGAPATAEPAPAAELETGWIQLGGAEWLGARVEIDGRFVGHAPLVHEVPVGPHQVRIAGAEGTELANRSLVLRPEHRRASPLRWVAGR